MLSKDEIVKRLEFHEGRKAKSYYCTAGYLTQGIGHNLDANPLTTAQKRKIKDLSCWSDSEIDMILMDDVYQCEVLLVQLIEGFDKFDDERQYALIDMCFQLGIGGVMGFKKMLSAMREGNWSEAKKQCLDSKYGRQTPIRAKRIAHLIETKEWLEKIEE